MSKKKTGLLVLGVLALGGLAFAGSAKADPTVPGNDPPPPPPPGSDDTPCPRGFSRAAPGAPCIPDPLPPPPTRKIKDYVGSGWKAWPRKDIFPTEQSFITALDALGYATAPGSSPISGVVMQKVGWFQSDYNKVVDFLGASAEKLVPDQLIGKRTTVAFVNADRWVDQTGKSWPQLVAEARA